MQTEAVRVAASCCRQSPRIAKRQSKSSRPDGHQLTARRRLALLVGGVKGVQLLGAVLAFIVGPGEVEPGLAAGERQEGHSNGGPAGCLCYHKASYRKAAL